MEWTQHVKTGFTHEITYCSFDYNVDMLMKAAILECAMFVQYAWAPEYKHYSVWGYRPLAPHYCSTTTLVLARVRCSVFRHGIAGVHDYVRGYGGSSDNGITRMVIFKHFLQWICFVKNTYNQCLMLQICYKNLPSKLCQGLMSF